MLESRQAAFVALSVFSLLPGVVGFGWGGLSLRQSSYTARTSTAATSTSATCLAHMMRHSSHDTTMHGDVGVGLGATYGRRITSPRPRYSMSPRSRSPGCVWAAQGTSEINVQNELADMLSEESIKTIISALNGLPDDVTSYIMAYTEVGATANRKNALTAGSYVVENPVVIGMDGLGIDVEVDVRTRSFFGKVSETKEKVRIPFGTSESLVKSEDVKRRLMEMSREQGRCKSTADIYKIPVGNYGGLPLNLKLNNVPHSMLARSFIYQGAAEAVVVAVQDKTVPRRMRLVCTVPELNTQMDTYRIGTMLELVRELTFSLADVGFNTRILVQPSMGEGIFKSLPLSLSGVMSTMLSMDWGEDDFLGTRVRMGNVGEEGDVTEEDDVVMVIMPQSIAGFSIHERLVKTVEHADGRPVILINPNLKDRPSSGGVMQVRGRGDRIAFAESFKDVYNYRLLYGSSTAFYPIKGAVMKAGPSEPYVVFERRDKAGGEEEYTPMATFDYNPDSGDITPLFP